MFMDFTGVRRNFIIMCTTLLGHIEDILRSLILRLMTGLSM